MWSAKASNDGAGPSKISTAPTCMCASAPSWARNDASIAVSRSPCCCAIRVLRVEKQERERTNRARGSARASSDQHGEEPGGQRENQHAGERALVAATVGEALEERPAR